MRFLALLVTGYAALGCQPTAPAADAPVASGEPVDYSFGTIEGELVGSATHRGRTTILLFLTTFDLASQAQAKRLEDLSRTHSPRLNAVGVALEPPQNVELLRTFARTVEIHFPLAMADNRTLAGTGPWGAVRAVPTWVLLDKQGRIRAAFSGSMNPSELEHWVQAAE